MVEKLIYSLIMKSSYSCEDKQPLLSPCLAVDSHKRKNGHFLKDICLPSKAAVVLVCLAVVIGAILAIFASIFTVLGVFFIGGKYINESGAICLIYFGIIVAVLLVPVSGFIADTKYGRYKVISASMCLIIIALGFMWGAAILIFLDPYSVYPSQWSHLKSVCFYVLISLFGAFFGIGWTSYYANFIQFGLDQLMEAPSKYLSLYVHWIMWADHLAYIIVIPITASVLCHKPIMVWLFVGISIIFSFLLIILLVVIRCNSHWFYTEPGQNNPYKSLIRILVFAWKHKYPLQRSAFTYCDDDIPSRLDFCKKNFGGPYSTEQVENVKTFFRIFFVLLAIGPVFVLNMAKDFYGLPLISTHIAHKGRKFCDIKFIFLESGALKYITSAVAVPVYIALTFSCLKRRRPSILTRLGIGMFLFLAGVLSILITDIIGHAQAEVQANSSSLCMFATTLNEKYFSIPHLQMHWASLIPINLLLGIGPLLVLITVLEFIAAQSPHSMKGLVVGLFYTISSFFTLLGSVALLPFSQKHIWQSQHMKEHPPVTNCGFGYFLFTCVVATIGLILFIIAAKKYKYRERDDRPFDQRFAVKYYERVIENREQDRDQVSDE